MKIPHQTPEPNAAPGPVVPLTMEGSSVLHQMMRVRWADIRGQEDALATEIAAWLQNHPQSAAYAMMGHKGDLMLVHYRPDFVGLLEAETALRRMEISRFLEPTTSYLSVVELGLYESTRKIWDELGAKGLTPASDGWEPAMAETLDRQKKAMATRLYPEIPESRYLCFYGMDRKRGEANNWYQVDFAERQRMMHEHGMVGRKYAGIVKQIISGSIGFDDWEWGVDLYAEDPVAFKRLIYEMRFDEVSAVFALFGPFYIGLRIQAGGVGAFLKGEIQTALG